jgi:hypothetical protein
MGPVKILLVDNDELYFKNIKAFFDEINNKTDNRYSYFPVEMSDFYKIRTHTGRMFSPREDISSTSIDFLKNLMSNADLLIIEYNLADAEDVTTLLDFNPSAIKFYELLGLEKKALFYTHAFGKDLKYIREKIGYAGLSDKVDMISRPLIYRQQVNGSEAMSFKESIEKILRK